MDAETVLLDTAAAPAAELAWSAEDAVEQDTEGTQGADARAGWWNRLRWAVAVTLLCATAAAAGWLATVFYHEEWGSPVATKPRAMPSVTVPVSPPPPTPAAPPATPAAPPKPVAAPKPPARQPSRPAPAPAPAPPPKAAASSPPSLPNPPAHAYEHYVQLLSRDGIIATDGPQAMHTQGYWICLAVSTDNTASINNLTAKSERKSPLLTPAQIRTMFAAAVRSYCPEYENDG